MVISWFFVKKGVSVEGYLPKPVGKMVLDATNLRSCNLFQLDDGDYITLEESLGGDVENEGEQEREEEEEGGEAEEIEESDSEIEENIRRKEVRTKKDHDAMTNEERVVTLLRQQNKMIEEGFYFMKAQFVTINQRLDRLEVGSSRGRVEQDSDEDVEDSEDDSS
ncbi:PREDICTED: major centromere autoantigen B-like [Ipomoea nil]|uniref:major centromere autoantigen B-like n=1 Tax=Ipomoea nil TaxID=35883 RepID=UPI00090092C5|nr:PREDICTED: major centromere autoantigen B-like [Ipomoea nil]